MMRFCLQITSVVLVAMSLTALPGCGSQAPATKPSDEPTAGHFEGDGHDHSKEAADHSGHDHEKEGEHK
jgi:predicted small lipoprotein YifL